MVPSASLQAITERIGRRFSSTLLRHVDARVPGEREQRERVGDVDVEEAAGLVGHARGVLRLLEVLVVGERPADLRPLQRVRPGSTRSSRRPGRPRPRCGAAAASPGAAGASCASRPRGRGRGEHEGHLGEAGRRQDPERGLALDVCDELVDADAEQVRERRERRGLTAEALACRRRGTRACRRAPPRCGATCSFAASPVSRSTNVADGAVVARLDRAGEPLELELRGVSTGSARLLHPAEGEPLVRAARRARPGSRRRPRARRRPTFSASIVACSLGDDRPAVDARRSRTPCSPRRRASRASASSFASSSGCVATDDLVLRSARARSRRRCRRARARRRAPTAAAPRRAACRARPRAAACSGSGRGAPAPCSHWSESRLVSSST